MRFYTVIAYIALLGPLACPKVSCNSNTDSVFYMDDEGSGEGPEVVGDPSFTHVDHEGSGSGARDRDRPYGASYDIFDMDDTEDDDYADDVDETRRFDEEVIEGSGTHGGTIIIDNDDEDPRLVVESEPDIREEVREEIIVEEGPNVESRPATDPPPTLTDTSDMDRVQIHTTNTDDRQVSIFAQPGILAAFIGGAVVGLLCAILLVMFIVYRMRKKDEGSYPLDEPKRMPLTSSYSPNDKEIYA